MYHRHARGRARCTFNERNTCRRERFENKMPIDAGRRDEATMEQHWERHFCRLCKRPPSSTLYRWLLCLCRCHLHLILLLPRETTKIVRISRDRRRKARSSKLMLYKRERETIPVEEGPFCPAHPTRGFRRPWSHWTTPWFNDSRHLSGAQCTNHAKKTIKSDEATNRSRNAIREAGRLLITELFERDKVARINPTGWPAGQVGFSLSFLLTSLHPPRTTHTG